MRGGAGIALVAVGIVLLWMAITGKLDCLTQFFSCAFGAVPPTVASNTSGKQNESDVGKFIDNLPGIINFANGLAGTGQPQTSSPFLTGQRI